MDKLADEVIMEHASGLPEYYGVPILVCLLELSVRVVGKGGGGTYLLLC
jgi:hypothetical protein